MKKIFVICLFLVTVCAVQAQRPVGDTLTMPEQDYYSSSSFHQCWPIGERGAWHTYPLDFNIMSAPIVRCMHNTRRSHLRDGNYIGGMQMFTERPLKIVGIAVCAYMQRPMDTTVCAYMQRPMDTTVRFFFDDFYGILGDRVDHEFYSDRYFLNTRDTTLKNRITDSAILYKVTASGPQRLASAPWRIEHPHRFIHLPPVQYRLIRAYIPENYSMPWTLFSNYDQDPVLPLYEVMFDSAVVVEDSFPVALRLRKQCGCGTTTPQGSTTSHRPSIKTLYAICPGR